MHVSAVFKERGVQRGEGVPFGVEITTQVCFDFLGVTEDFRRQTAYFHTARQIVQQRELARESPVHEYELAVNTGNTIRIEVFSRNLSCVLARQLKSSLRDGGNIGEAPVLVVSGGKSDLTKTRKRILAQPAQPWQAATNHMLLQFGEALQIIF